MKTITTACCLFLFLSATCQTHGNVFKQVAIEETTNGDVISFTVFNEANVKGYVVAAYKNDTAMEILTMLPSAGNTTMPRNYQFTSFSNYKKYQVQQLNFNHSIVAVQNINTSSLKKYEAEPLNTKDTPVVTR